MALINAKDDVELAVHMGGDVGMQPPMASLRHARRDPAQTDLTEERFTGGNATRDKCKAVEICPMGQKVPEAQWARASR